jgi:hypothetical protein
LGDFDIEKILSDNVGGDMKEFGGDDMEKAGKKLAEVPKETNQKEMICPHCGETFFIDG